MINNLWYTFVEAIRENINKDVNYGLLFGKIRLETLQRGEEHSFLLVNGLGGYCSQTVIGSNARHDHNLLTAALVAPTKRFAMVRQNRRDSSCGQQCLSSGFTGVCYIIR